MTTQDSPEPGDLSEPGSLVAAAAWLAPGITPTPALRGFPGGPGLPEPGRAGPGGCPRGTEAAGTVAGAGAGAGPAQSAWQCSYRAWAGADIGWVREPGWLPARAWAGEPRAYWVAGADHDRAAADGDHTQPIPALRARPAAGRFPGRPAVRVTAGLACVAIALTGVLSVTFARRPASAPRRDGLLSGYPAARLAGSLLTSGVPATGTRLPPSLSAVAASGTTVVATGQQVGTSAPRPVILASADGGLSWRPASLQAPDGDVAGAAPSLLAGSPRGWLALGSHASWLSASGQVWHRAPGIPLRAGDRVLSLARAATGFVAVGTSGRTRVGLVWTSPNGITWRRRTAAALGLWARARRVAALRQVAARGATVVVTGSVVPAGVRTVPVPPATRAWRSGDGGATWTQLAVPRSHGAAGQLGGVAPDQAGFALIRPGHGRGGRPDAVAYQSADGRSWRFAGVLAGGGSRALRLTGVSGNDAGAVLTAAETAGRAPGTEVAFVTGSGRSWQRVVLLRAGTAGTLAGAAAEPGGSVVAAGSAVTAASGGAAPSGAPGGAAPSGAAASGAASSAAAGLARRPFLLLAGRRYAFTGQQALARAATAGVSVTGLASGGGRDVAVGSAAGRAVIWTRTGGRWSADPLGTWAVSGLTLSSVTYGSGNWLALGQAARHGRPGLVVLASTDGRAWRAVRGLGKLAGPGSLVAQAAAARTGYVLVGRRPGSGGRPAAAAWWSAAPGAWSRALVPAADPARAAGPARAARATPVRRATRPPSQMLAVTAGGPGFVASGALGSHPAVWSSADGRKWAATVLPVPAGARSAVLRQVAASRRRVAAAGTEDTAAGRLPFAAVSADSGRTWREFALPLPGCQPGVPVPGAARAAVTAIVAAGGGFVITGTCGLPGQQDVLVWSSADGRAWTAAHPHRPGLSGPGAQQITALTVNGGSVTGAGYTATPAADHPTLWQVRIR